MCCLDRGFKNTDGAANLGETWGDPSYRDPDPQGNDVIMKVPHANKLNSMPRCELRTGGGQSAKGVGRDSCRGPRVRLQIGGLGLQPKVTGGVRYLQACCVPPVSPQCGSRCLDVKEESCKLQRYR